MEVRCSITHCVDRMQLIVVDIAPTYSVHRTNFEAGFLLQAHLSNTFLKAYVPVCVKINSGILFLHCLIFLPLCIHSCHHL